MECHMMAIAARIFKTYSAGRDHEREAAGFERGFYGEADEKFDLSLLKSRFGRGIGLPMKTLADEF
jgi:hypothetical protein